ncbi:MAG: phosphotransferase [Gammaproteobacteria bacterium]
MPQGRTRAHRKHPVTGRARQVLEDLYGFDAEVTPLYGELDDNFLAVSATGEKRILKLMHEGASAQRVDLQCCALAHLAELAGDPRLPAVIPTRAGERFASASIGPAERIVWSLTFCSGTPLSEFAPHTRALLRSFGRSLGRIDRALESFTHPAMHQDHQWQLTRAGEARRHLGHMSDDAAGQLAAVLGRFDDAVAGQFTDLPHGVIHNDANDDNALVNVSDDGEARVDGLIDFGDISYQPRICEVAIALAYVVLRKNEPLEACAAFLQGYNAVVPVGDAELAVLLDLIRTRLAVSIAIAAARRIEGPACGFDSFDRRPAESALTRLAAIPPRDAERAFRRACAGS